MTRFKFGIVSEAKPGFAKVFFKEDGLPSDWLPVLVRTSMKDKESWILNINEHVVCLCDEYLEDGVILGAIHSDPEPPDSGAAASKFRQVFEDGTYVEYDKESHILTANVQGSVICSATKDITASAGQSISAQASTQVTLKGPVINLQGNVNVIGVVSAGGLTLSSIPEAEGADGKVHGDININGAVNASGDVKSGSISLSNHKHIGVQTGTGVSGGPTS